MKPVWLLLFIAIGCSATANDTLTRAQVYNFNVGDTFDYEIMYTYLDYISLEEDSAKAYERYVITYVGYSADSAIKYISRLQVSTGRTLTDTFTSLQQQEIYLDTGCYNNGIDIECDLTGYNNRRLNMLDKGLCTYFGGYYLTFAEGLGLVSYDYGVGCGVCGYYSDSSTTLIYYSQAGEVWGTPYYLLTALNNVTGPATAIQIYPNPASNLLYIKSEALHAQTITIYDVNGQTIAKQAFAPEINIHNLSPGIYLLEVTAADGVARKRWVKM